MNDAIIRQLEQAVHDGVMKAVHETLLKSYNNPIGDMVKAAVENKSAGLSGLLDEALQGCVADDEFRREVKTGVRIQLGKLLVQRFGGELEKQVNELKSNPTTRAKITLAIDEIVKSASK